MKPVIWAEIANKSIITLIARRPSFDERDNKPRIPERTERRVSNANMYFKRSKNDCTDSWWKYKRIYLPGTQHKQFVTIAALTESNSGITMNMSSATPIVCSDSIKKMKRKCERCGLFHDLKKQIRMARMNAPISGMENAITNAHIHATRSSSGIMDTNDLSRPCLHKKYTKYIENSP